MALVAPLIGSIPRAEARPRRSWLPLAALPLGARLPVRPGGWPQRLPVRLEGPWRSCQKWRLKGNGRKRKEKTMDFWKGMARPGLERKPLRPLNLAMAGYRVSFAPEALAQESRPRKVLSRMQTEGPQRLQEAAEVREQLKRHSLACDIYIYKLEI